MSSRMSSTCSMPTEMRTMSRVTPAVSSSSSFSWRWVVVAGWQARDYASPMFTSLVISLRASMNFAPASWPPSMPKLRMPAARPPMYFSARG